MNIQEFDILNVLLAEPYETQRRLAERSGHSLGIVNRSLKALAQAGYLDGQFQPTQQALDLSRKNSPKNAVILAAGFGMRMVPINTSAPKGLLEIHGEPLIERLIRQLQAVGIRDITLVVGFMKEQYEYLMDEFGVSLVVSRDYARKNNLHSLALAASRLGNTYVVPCDIWCPENPFRQRELYPWYMVSDATTPDSGLRVSRKLELVPAPDTTPGNRMVGIAYLLEKQSQTVRERLLEMCRDPGNDGCFWEEALYEKGRFLLPPRVVPAEAAVEINTYEQLRELDSHSSQLKNEAIDVIAGTMGVTTGEITDISVLKKGMTNRSFRFRCKGREYIMRIPGEGTDQLISRPHEAAVYAAIRGQGLCSDLDYINPDNGYKITRFLDNARVCDPENWADVSRCMEKLRQFHHLGLQVDHAFDLFGQIEFYESLWNGAPSAYKDHARTRQQVFSLRPYIEAHAEKKALTHIDAVPDNFLFVRSGDREDLQLIDWEYAGMQDPHVDVAMFIIYAMYGRAQADRLIDTYFEGACPRETRIKIYCYIAVCGLLWSDWCEYKRSLGVEFGEYSLRQYRYAKDYYKLVREMLEEEPPCTR